MPGLSLWELRGRVKELAPNRTNKFIDGAINKYIRKVTQQRWSDLMRTGMIVIPDAYSTGTVALANNSRIATGTGTAWPTNDRVNTTLNEDVNESPGFQKALPASMTNIEAGSLLLIESENSSLAEIVPVYSVSADSFTAYFQKSHGASATIIASRLAGLQFRAASYVYTVQAALSATQLQLDMAYGGEGATDLSYLVYKGYATISPTVQRLLYAWDAIAGQPINCNRTVDWLNVADPQRTASGNPQELVSTIPSATKLMQWEIWPQQLSAYGLGVIYQDGWPVLVDDNDLSPPFLNPEIFIAGASSDSRSIKVLQNTRQGNDPYYDPIMSKRDLDQHEQMLEDAIQNDQGRYMSMLTNYQQQLVGGSNYNYFRNHLGCWPSDFGG